MNLRKYLSTMRDYDSDDVLGIMGLQRQAGGDWVFPMLAGVGAGMAIGAGIAFFLTPYKGTEAREKFVKASGDAQKFLTQQVGTLSDKVALLTEKVGTMAGEGSKETGSVTTARTMNVGGTGTPAIGASTGGGGGVGSSSGIGSATGGNGNRGY